MRNRICLAAAMLCVLANDPAAAQSRTSSVLERKVTVTFNEAPLESVLRTLRRQYGVRVSYSNTALNLRQPVTLNVQNQPLRTVLNELLRDKNIGYELVGDQVVLHPSAPKAAATKPANTAAAAQTTTTVSKAVVDKAPETAPAAAPAARPANGTTEAAKSAERESPVPARAGAKDATPAPAAPKPAAPKPAVPKKSPAGKPTSAAVKTSATGKATAATASARKAASSSMPGELPKAASNATTASTGTVAGAGQGRTSSTTPGGAAPTDPEATAAAARTGTAAAQPAPAQPTAPVPTQPATAAPPAAAQDSVAAAVPPAGEEQPARPTFTKPAQISFIGPLGSNGRRSGQTVNKVSINVLGGYAAGVNGFEAAGLFNIDRDSVRGVQLAGLANIVGKHVDGFQGAGLLNVVGGGGTGWQAAGLLNIATRPIAGAQTAGLFNYVGPSKKLGSDTGAGAEVGSTRRPAVQAAGLFNVALTEVRGSQAAGLFNVARKVHGVQLAGLLNVADSVDGVSIAPLNFIRRGYHRAEILNSEVWPVSASLKLGGSPAFYTYFTGAYDGFGSRARRWGLGYGLGTEVWARRRLSLSMDAQALHVNEESQGWTEALNLHNQLRLMVGFAPFKAGGRLRVVAGATANVLVTERYDSTEGRVYSSVADGQRLWLDEGSASTRVLGWFDYSIGLRF